jgi:N,N'-diacetyllegionaminate synthase
VQIIAEAANSHEGREADLVTLVRLAAAAGADAVKAQLVFAHELCTRDYRHFETFRRYELDEGAWGRVARGASEAGCPLYLDVFGPDSMRIAQAVGASGVKLHASDTANRALIETVAVSDVERVVVAVGGSTRGEIAEALEILAGKRVVLMHGFQGYPTELADNQIARILALRQSFPGVEVGFADHVPFDDPARGWLPAVAIGAGASVLEKHITLATVQRGLDHDAALNPDEFAAFVAAMRLAASAMGAATADEADYGMSAAELRYRAAARKSLVAARDLRAGEALRIGDLALKRSDHPDAEALDPRLVSGRTLLADVACDQPIFAAILADRP